MRKWKKLCSLWLVLLMVLSCFGNVTTVHAESLGTCNDGCTYTYYHTGKEFHIAYCANCRYAVQASHQFNYDSEDYICTECGLSKLEVGNKVKEYETAEDGTHIVFINGNEIGTETCLYDHNNSCIFCEYHQCEEEYYDNYDDATHQVLCPYCMNSYDEVHLIGEDGRCIYCGTFMEEGGEHVCEWQYQEAGDGKHIVWCVECGDKYAEDHIYGEDGICIYCNAVFGGGLETHECSFQYRDIGDETHEMYCEECGISFIERHTYTEDGHCIYCGAAMEEGGEHVCEWQYQEAGDGKHIVWCVECGDKYAEDHTYGEDGTCIFCDVIIGGGEIVEPTPGDGEDPDDEEHEHDFEYIDNKDGTHTISCKDCEYSCIDDCVYDVDGYCEECGGSSERIDEVIPTITKISNTAKGIKLSWREIEIADGYYIFRKEGKGKWKKVKNTGDTSWIDNKAKKNGEKYQYKICAYADNKASEDSEVSTIYRLVKTNIAAAKNVKGKKIKVKWQTNTKASGYEIQYATNRSLENAQSINVSGAKKKEKTIVKLTKGRKYYIRVRSYIKIGKVKQYSEWSSTKSVMVRK